MPVTRWGPLLSLLAAVSLAAVPAGAEISKGQFIGRWAGTTLCSYKGKKVEAPVTIIFAEDTVTVESSSGRYEIAGDEVRLFLDGSDSTVLRQVRIAAGMLVAEVSTPTDPPGMFTTLRLQRQPAMASTGVEPTCDGLPLPKEISQQFEKYALICPIVIPDSFEERLFVRELLLSLARTITSKEVEISINAEGVWIDADEKPEQVAAALRPLLARPQDLHVNESQSVCPPGMRCALNIFSVLDFKPKFRDGKGRLKIGAVWSTMVQEVTRHGINLEPPSKSGERRLISAPTLVAAGPSGIFYQVIKLQLTETNSPGAEVQLYIGAEVWRKPALAVKRPIKVLAECDIHAVSALGFVCIDHSIMQAVTRLLLEESRGI